MKSSAYCFFPYQLHTYQKAMNALKEFLQGESDIQTLNQYLPDLYHSSLKKDIKEWLAFNK